MLQVYGIDQLKKIVAESDYLVVCMALTSATKKMINADVLRHAKRGQILINIGRGALIDEEAMIRALQNGTLAGAALDVFTVEPLPESSPLWGLPNVLLSPHNVDLLHNSRHMSVRFFTENCRKFLAQEPFENCVVDKTAGY